MKKMRYSRPFNLLLRLFKYFLISLFSFLIFFIISYMLGEQKLAILLVSELAPWLLRFICVVGGIMTAATIAESLWP